MLVSFSFRNFKSFKDENTISFISDISDIDNEYSIPTAFDYSVLKSTAVYGANASGKTKLFEAFSFMKKVVSPPLSSPGVPAFQVWKKFYSPFRLSTVSENSTSFFEVVLIIDNIQYRYGIELSAAGILDEWLYRKAQRETLILSRTASEDGKLAIKTTGKYINTKISDNIRDAGMVSPDAPLLTLLATFNDSLSKRIIMEFDGIKVISANEMETPVLALKDEAGKLEVIRFMRAFDINIEDYKLHEISPDDIPDKIRSIIGDENLRGTFYDGIVTTHRLYDGNYNNVGTMPFILEIDESFGTNRLFRLSWPILQALKGGRTLLIDEIDSGLHPFIVTAIVKLFYAVGNGAQLIINTQSPTLLSSVIGYGDRGCKKYLFRKDQIYVVNKNLYGESNVLPIMRYRTKRDTNLEKPYLEGLFSGVPYVDSDNITDHES